MKQIIRRFICTIAAAFISHSSTAAPIGTGFTYQGRLVQNGTPFNGTAHLRFSLWDAVGSGSPPTGGNQIGNSQILANVAVANGLFAVLLNDAGEFGPNAFDGDARWLQVEVCATGTCTSSTVLSPRQAVSPAPVALHAAGPWKTNGNSVSYINGNVGIGTANPTSKLEISAQDGLAITGFQPFLTLRDASAGNKRGLISTGDGDLGFYTNSSIGTIPSVIVKDNTGNVGIGTGSPTSKLEIIGQNGLAITGFQPYLTLRDTNAGGARALISTGNGDVGFYTDSSIGSSPPVIIKNNSGNVGIGTGAPAHKLHIAGEGASGYAIGIEGNATQNRDKGGWVKAMALVNADGSIARQFSAFGGSLTGTYNVSYYITFPFQVNDRFISVTPLVNHSVFELTFAVEFDDQDTVSVTLYDVENPGGAIANRFFIFVY